MADEVMVNVTATPTRDEVPSSSPYLRVLAQHLERIAEVDKMLVLREEIDGTNRVIVPTSLIGEVIEEAYQGLERHRKASRKCWNALYTRTAGPE